MEEYLQPADFAFLEMPLEGRVMVLDDVLSSVPEQRRRALLRDSDRLAIEAEAWCIGLQGPNVDELMRYLLPSWLDRLAAAVEEALLARLPSIA